MSDDGDDAAAAPAPLIDLSLSAHLRKSGGELVNTPSFGSRLAVGEEPTDKEEEDKETTKKLLEEFTERIIPTGELLEDFAERTILLDRGESSFSFIQCPQNTITSDIKDSMCKSVEVETDESSTAAEKDAANSAPGGTPTTVVSESFVIGELFTEKKDEAVQIVSLVEAASAIHSVMSLSCSNSNGKIAQNRVTASANLSPTNSYFTRKESRESIKKINNKNPFDSFGEYVVNLFHKTVIYEEELELRQIQQDQRLNNSWHGNSRRNIQMSIEGQQASTSTADSTTDEKLKNANGSTPLKLDALAAIEAISGFRNMSDVKRQLKAEHSFKALDADHTKKKHRFADEAPTETEASKKDQEEDWAIFFRERDKIKFSEAAIEVSVFTLYDTHLLSSINIYLYTR
jgi:hypothetical protein